MPQSQDSALLLTVTVTSTGIGFLDDEHEVNLGVRDLNRKQILVYFHSALMEPELLTVSSTANGAANHSSISSMSDFVVTRDHRASHCITGATDAYKYHLYVSLLN